MSLAVPHHNLATIKILFLEGVRHNRLVFMHQIKQLGFPYECKFAGSVTAALSILNNFTFQIAILDCDLVNDGASQLFSLLDKISCPIIISIGIGQEETAVKLMERGAVDYLIKDPEGNYLKILPITINKTLNRHQVEEQLQLFSHAIQIVSDSIYILNGEGQLQFINQALANLCNISLQEAIGKPIQVLGQPHLEDWLNNQSFYRDDNGTYEGQIAMRRNNGTYFWASISESCFREDSRTIRVGVIRDVTSLKQIEFELRNSQQNLVQSVQERTAQAIAELQRENQERLKIEESLRLSRDHLQQEQEFFKLVIDSNPNLIFVKDWEGRYLLANQAMAEFYNTDIESLVNRKDIDFHPNTLEVDRFVQENRKIIETQQYVFLPEERVSHANLEYQWLQWQKYPIKLPNQIIPNQSNSFGVLGVGVNITSRKQIELTLQKLVAGTAAVTGEEFFPALVQNIAEALDIPYALVTEFVGDRLCSLGFWANGSLQSSISYVPFRTPCEIALQKGEYYCEKCVQAIFPEDLDLVAMQVESYLGIALSDDRGNGIGNLCILDTKPFPESKLTEAIAILKVFAARASAELQRKAANEALNRINQNLEMQVQQRTQDLHRVNQELIRATRLKDEFLANMSHELRTPLNAILGITEGLQSEVFDAITPKQVNALQIIERSGTHLLSLINDILDVAKIESGQISLNLTATNIEALCQSSLAFVRQQALKKQIQIIDKIPKYLPEIMLDERRIRQVLINLLSNAVKFTPEGGSITLEVSQIPASSLSPLSTETLQAEPSYLRIAIVDTGIGIAAADMPKIFQPFVQIDSALNRQHNGTGLGLTLVKQLVELHSGKIEVISQLGLGSCFAIAIPYLLPSSSENNLALNPSAPIELPAQKSSQIPLILLAEDNEANILTVSSYLSAKGYEVILARDGQEAITLTKLHQLDVILMDIQMPIMDGFEAIKQIRLDPHLADIPIIALTSFAMDGDREKCLAAGANDYLPKPIRLKALEQIIQKYLHCKNNNNKAKVIK